MIKLLIKKFIHDSDNTQDNKVREAYSVLTGVLGIICNLFLFIVKISIGGFMRSMAIISDAFNNLSDIGSSLISIIGAKLSNKKPDREHPFGHGRFEYISSLIVSFVIMLVGFELLKSAVAKIVHPQAIETNLIMTVFLLLSVLVKIWMYSYNKYTGRKIDSKILLAASQDSLNDAVSTVSVIIAAIVAKLTGLLWLDALIGAVVSLIIMKSGFDIAKDTIGVLLGTPPDKETVEKIVQLIEEEDEIVGVHDLIVHDYGPGRIMASIHAEIPDNSDVVKIHEIIDELENKIEREMGIHMVIHMDPISVDCERTLEIKTKVLETVKNIDEKFNIHDFRMTDGENRINLIFDVEVPAGADRETIAKRLTEDLKNIDERFTPVMKFDTVYE